MKRDWVLLAIIIVNAIIVAANLAEQVRFHYELEEIREIQQELNSSLHPPVVPV